MAGSSVVHKTLGNAKNEGGEAGHVFVGLSHILIWSGTDGGKTESFTLGTDVVVSLLVSLGVSGGHLEVTGSGESLTGLLLGDGEVVVSGLDVSEVEGLGGGGHAGNSEG